MNNIELATVLVDEIYEDERVRKEIGNVRELITSIRRDGLIQPLAVCDVPSGQGKYRLLAGGRRLKAIKEAGISKVPVRVYSNLTVLQMKSIELSENIHRKDLTYAEECELCRQINDLQVAIHGRKVSTQSDADGWSQTDTADLLGMDKGSVSRKIQLSEAIQLFPELANFKNESEARKAMENLVRTAAREELANQLEVQRRETPLDMQRQQLVNNFILKDFFVGVKEIPDEFADLIEIDPPYGIALEHVKKLKLESTRELLKESYNEISSDQYPIFLDGVLKECRRILKNTGWLIFWFGQDPWWITFIRMLKKYEFIFPEIPGIWMKGDEESASGQFQTMQPQHRLSNAYETFFYARRNNNAKIVKQGRPNVFSYRQVPVGIKSHPTERPVELMEEILLTFTEVGSQIVIPFLGSGNTLLAATNLGMKAFGYELSKKYKDAYTIRVFEGEPGSYKSYP